MRLEFRLSLKDYQEAYIANYKSQRTSYFFLWGLSIIAIGLGLLYLFSPTLSSLLMRIVGLLFILLGIGLIPTLYYRLFMLKAWRDNPNLREPIAIEITDEGIIYIAESIQANIKWPVCSHFIETPNLFLIYPFQQLYGVLPKRTFYTSEQAIEFRRLLQQKIGNQKQFPS
ncbi:MAG: YcxB family protein [Cyanobacteriota bacterium]|nr:YcxB family protein [Cyanobacteriota bacterium]